jgi:hypothetical protein
MEPQFPVISLCVTLRQRDSRRRITLRLGLPQLNALGLGRRGALRYCFHTAEHFSPFVTAHVRERLICGFETTLLQAAASASFTDLSSVASSRTMVAPSLPSLPGTGANAGPTNAACWSDVSRTTAQESAVPSSVANVLRFTRNCGRAQRKTSSAPGKDRAVRRNSSGVMPDHNVTWQSICRSKSGVDERSWKPRQPPR